MGKPLDPGPPLQAPEEYCEADPPNLGDYLKATGITLLVTAGMAVGWFAFAMATRKVWSVVDVVAGLAVGLAVNSAASRHRSSWLGAMAGTGAVLATAIGYSLLWLPFVDPAAVDRQFSWYHLFAVALAAFIAYRLAGPKTQPNSEQP